MLPHNFAIGQDKEIINMDTNETIRYTSESPFSGTSGYATSPGPSNSPSSSGYSPVQSPLSAVRTEFSHLAIPEYQPEYQQLTSQPMNHTVMYNYSIGDNNAHANSFGGNLANPLALYDGCQLNGHDQYAAPRGYPAKLKITEEPVEKFRFRYKSEMHGTHGSLNGRSSNRSSKSFPEVELKGYDGPAIIRCSLFQADLKSPHSHQLVVRRDEHDICDPHELNVSKDLGYFAEFKNMGIIHTAKKFIVEELLKKKRKRLLFELGRDDLTTKEEQELNKQTEKEAKDMNLNQVRLCFEAFRLDDNHLYTAIAPPVYSTLINNRKSAQTGELRITRLSIATGSVTGGEDLILLVEKVSKKNIKVRFFEMNDDEQVWEAFATFRESDVHHQYAIVCRTPPYRNKDIDRTVEVFVELMRPSDDERSYPPVSFRYKPRDAVISRKRKRTCSNVSGSSGSYSGSLSSGEIPKPVQEQQQTGDLVRMLSEEIDRILANPEYKQKFKEFSSEDFSNLFKNIDPVSAVGKEELDGAPEENVEKRLHFKKIIISKENSENKLQPTVEGCMQKISKKYSDTKNLPSDTEEFRNASDAIRKLYEEYTDTTGESLMHEIVENDSLKYGRTLCNILECFKLQHLLNTNLNRRDQTALHSACLHDKPQYVRPLLNLQCNPNKPDARGDTALHIAVRENSLDCLVSLTINRNNLPLKTLNYDGYTPLHLAVRRDNQDLTSKLLKLDNSIAAVSNSVDGNNSLHMAVKQQNLEMVKLIMENQEKDLVLNSRNTAGQTPLELAKLLSSSSEQAAYILSYLLQFANLTQNSTPFSDLDDNHSYLVIKEESSSEDEDECVSNKCSSEHTECENICIKEEFIEEEPTYAADIMNALNNKETFYMLCEAFSSNDCWKTELQIPPFYLKDPLASLGYVKRNINSIDINSLCKVIRDVCPDFFNHIKKK